MNSANSVKARDLSITHGHKCHIETLSTFSGIGGVRRRVHRFGPSITTLISRSTTGSLGIHMTSADAGVLSNSRKIYRYTTCSGSSAMLGSIINVTKLRPALATVGTRGGLTLTGGRALITNNELIVSATTERGMSVLPISSRRSTVFRTLRKGPSGETLGGVVLATSNNPFFNGATRRLRGIAIGSTLGRPG